MINVTDTIKQAYDTSTTQCDKIVIDNIEYAINNVQYEDDCYDEGNIFGTAIARTLQFEIENSANLEGKELEYLTGIKTANGVEWISLGNFIVESVEPNDTTNINIVNAMDYMLKSNIEYVSLLDYSSEEITALQVLQEACTNAGLALATTNFPNKDFIVDSNQFEQGTLIRQVIQAVAQISGTVAKIKSDNKLYLINPNSVTEVSKVFTLNDYAEAEIKRATHPINLVSLGMNDVEGENITLRDEESIEEDGENSLVINDNPFAYTQEKREQLITALFNAVKGFEYKAFLFNCQGLPYLETMDKIQFKDKQGNTYNSYVFRFNYKSPNGLESQIEAPSIIKATVNYQNIPSALDRLKRTELIVDKQNQTITGLVQSTTENSKKLAQQQITIDGITQKVENVVETTKTVKGIQTITLDNCVDGNLLELRIFGHNTNFDFLFPDEDLFPSEDLFPNHDEENMTATYMVAVAHEDGTSEVYRLAETYWLSKNSETQDMYELKDGKATITRRVNIYDGTTQEEEIEELGVKSISLKAGTNIITLLSHNATIEAKYAIQNEYTKNFATKVEMNSAIKQTEDNINLSVNKTLESYSTTEEMEAAIDLKADQITSTVQTTINDLEIGGRNYLVGSNAYRRSSPVGFENVTGNDTFKVVPDMEAEVIPGETYILQVKSDGEVAPYHGYQHEDTRYKFTVWFYLFEENSTAIDFDMAVSCTGNTENTNPKYLGKVDNTYYWQYTIPAEMVKAKIRINTYADTENPQTINFWDFKLEKGNKPTDWSPPSEDTDMAISQIKQTADEVSIIVEGKVGKDEIKTEINASKESVKIKSGNIDINGVISANGNFKVGTDGKMECTGAKINATDKGLNSGNAGIIAESTNYYGEYFSNGLYLGNKNVQNADFVWIVPGQITTYNEQRYGFDFGVASDNRIIWIVKDSAGRLISTNDTQFNLYSPGENTNLSLRNNGAFINGYQIQTNASDRRLKTNIQDSTENALDKIMQIQHRSFDWKENGEHQKNGYIAQELEQIDKEFVIVNEDKYSINLLNLLSTVTKAMQEQQEQMERLKKEQQLEIEQLKQEIEALKGAEK